MSKGGIPNNKYDPKYIPYYYPFSEGSEPDMDVRTTLGPVPEEEANLEAEAGESVYIPDVGGLPAHYKIGGKRHSEGGTPLSVPQDSFIYSDTRSMKLGGDILKFFGKPEDTKKKYTPADLAKQYPLNEFRKQLQNPDSDPIQVKTAEMMIANYNRKLGALALVQEASKGFETGIPIAALPYLASMVIEPEQVLPLQGTEEGSFSDMTPQMKKGGNAFQNGAQGTGYAEGGEWKAKLAQMTADRIRREQEQAQLVQQWQKDINNRQMSNTSQSNTAWADKELKRIEGEIGLLLSSGRLSQATEKQVITLGDKYDKLLKQRETFIQPANYTPQATGAGIFQNMFPAMIAPQTDFVVAPSTVAQPQLMSPEMFPVTNPTELPPLTAAQIDSAWVANGYKSNLHKYGGLVKAKDGIEVKKEGDKMVMYYYGVKQFERPLPSVPTSSTIPTEKVSQRASNAAPGGITAWAGDRNDKSNASQYSSAQWREFAKEFCPECKTNAQLQKKILTEPAFADDVKRLHSPEAYGMPKNSPSEMADNKLGHRWDFVFKPKPASVVPAPVARAVAKAASIETPKVDSYVTDPTYAPWWTQDVIKTMGAAGDFLRVKKYLPWAPKVAPYVPDATFYDPTRELASNAEQMAIGTQGASSFGNPQQYNSRFSGIQGQGAKNAADILGRYNNLNVGVANQHEAQVAGIYNKVNEVNANIATDLYDKTTIANQQFDNSKNMARQELRQSYIDAWTNRGDTQRENAMFRNFYVDPTTGFGHVVNKHAPLDPSYGTSGPSADAEMEAWIKSHPNMTEEQYRAWQIASKLYGPQADYTEEKTKRLSTGYRGR